MTPLRVGQYIATVLFTLTPLLKLLYEMSVGQPDWRMFFVFTVVIALIFFVLRVIGEYEKRGEIDEQ